MLGGGGEADRQEDSHLWSPAGGINYVYSVFVHSLYGIHFVHSVFLHCLCGINYVHNVFVHNVQVHSVYVLSVYVQSVYVQVCTSECERAKCAECVLSLIHI